MLLPCLASFSMYNLARLSLDSIKAWPELYFFFFLIHIYLARKKSIQKELSRFFYIFLERNNFSCTCANVHMDTILTKIPPPAPGEGSASAVDTVQQISPCN